MLPKQCSKEFKVRVIQRKVRELLGLAPRQRGPKKLAVEQWLGISTDEAHRMKPSELRYVENRFPLIELYMNRDACRAWLSKSGWQAPKSACVFCPYHDAAYWRAMKKNEPEDFERACVIDEAIRPGFYGMEGEAYVHRTRVPLREVDLSTSESLFDLFGNECEGVCGV